MKTAVLLNDTSYENHHGCNIVIANIKECLEERDIKLLASNPIGKKWKTNKVFLEALNICDIVIVNGEGTIHHDSLYGLELLEIVNVVKEKPCILMNMTYQSNSKKYATLVKRFKKVYVRESYSQNELVQQGIMADVVPDMTFYRSYQVCTDRTETTYITDSHDIQKSEKLYSIAQRMGWKFFPVLSPFEKVSNLKNFSKKIRYQFLQKYAYSISKWISLKYAYIRYGDVMDEITYLSEISKAKCLITARFHALCFAIQTQTPFFAIASNTYKVEGLLNDIGLGNKRMIDILALENIEENSCILTPEEKMKIEEYNILARQKIDTMFNEISQLI